MTTLDLNADLGEGMGDDEALLEIVSSASIACGGHAGDEATMRTVVRAAKARGVAIGAHPGFVDPEHFGRRRLQLSPEALTAQIREQVGRLAAIGEAEGFPLRYVKLHGALANMAAEDSAIAVVAFAALQENWPHLAILAIDNSAQVDVAGMLGFRVIREAYADRGYRPDGLLVPRSEPGAVLHDIDEIANRALGLAKRGELVAVDGSIIKTEARSLCIHGDTPAAVEIARAVRKALSANGISVASAV